MTQRFGSCGLTSPLRRLRWSRQMRRRSLSRRRVMRCAHRSFFAGFAGCLSRLAGRALPSCSRSLSRSLHMLRRMQVRLSETELEDEKMALRLSLAEMNDAAAARALQLAEWTVPAQPSVCLVWPHTANTCRRPFLLLLCTLLACADPDAYSYCSLRSRRRDRPACPRTLL